MPPSCAVTTRCHVVPGARPLTVDDRFVPVLTLTSAFASVAEVRLLVCAYRLYVQPGVGLASQANVPLPASVASGNSRTAKTILW